jgi:hypothetical protein
VLIDPPALVCEGLDHAEIERERMEMPADGIEHGAPVAIAVVVVGRRQRHSILSSKLMMRVAGIEAVVPGHRDDTDTD